jgi:hypothetical protein
MDQDLDDDLIDHEACDGDLLITTEKNGVTIKAPVNARTA